MHKGKGDSLKELFCTATIASSHVFALSSKMNKSFQTVLLISHSSLQGFFNLELCVRSINIL